MRKLLFLLRGINVGGHNKLPMALLKEIAGEIGIQNATTYIQSGNLVGRVTEDKSSHEWAEELSKALLKKTGMQLPVISFWVEEWKEVLENCPFEVEEEKLLNVSVVEREIVVEKQDCLATISKGNERYAFKGRAFYLHSPEGYRTTAFTPQKLEKCLQQATTTRNWRSCRAIDALLDS